MIRSSKYLSKRNRWRLSARISVSRGFRMERSWQSVAISGRKGKIRFPAQPNYIRRSRSAFSELRYAITAVHLTLRAKVPGIDQAGFAKMAGDAKAGCPVSKLLN